MALYRIFPEKDTFISNEPSIAGSYGNAGRDEGWARSKAFWSLWGRPERTHL